MLNRRVLLTLSPHKIVAVLNADDIFFCHILTEQMSMKLDLSAKCAEVDPKAKVLFCLSEAIGVPISVDITVLDTTPARRMEIKFSEQVTQVLVDFSSFGIETSNKSACVRIVLASIGSATSPTEISKFLTSCCVGRALNQITLSVSNLPPPLFYVPIGTSPEEVQQTHIHVDHMFNDPTSIFFCGAARDGPFVPKALRAKWNICHAALIDVPQTADRHTLYLPHCGYFPIDMPVPKPSPRVRVISTQPGCYVLHEYGKPDRIISV